MTKLGTIYDKELKEKVFYLRGEENYAHTTDITVSYTERILSADCITLHGLSITTYRDVGNATITIYNNDDVIATYDWSNGSPVETVADIELDYNIDNNLKFVYSGNSSCLPSEYYFDTINLPNTTAYPTEILITSDIRFGNTDTVLLTGVLSSENHMDLVGNQDISIYIDNLYDTTVTTDDDGEFSALLSIVDDGLYDVDATFSGADTSGGRISSSSASVDISKGCKITVDPPAIFYDGADNNISFLVTDYHNQPIANQNVVFNSIFESTNEYGIVSYTVTTLNDEEYIITSDGASTTYTPNIVSNLAVTIGNPVETKNNVLTTISSTVTGTNIQQGIPVQFKLVGDNFEEVLATVLTDNNGVATLDYLGQGKGSYNLVAELPTEYTSPQVSFNDYIEYGVANRSDSLSQYTTYYPTTSLTTLQSGYKLINSNSNVVIFYNPLISNNYEVSFKVVSATSPLKITWGLYNEDSTFLMPTRADLSLKANNMVYIIKSGNTLTLKVGTSTIDTISFTGVNRSSPFLALLNVGSQQLTFNNFKIIRS